MSRANKKFSLLFINNDEKTYQAYKNMVSKQTISQYHFTPTKVRDSNKKNSNLNSRINTEINPNDHSNLKNVTRIGNKTPSPTRDAYLQFKGIKNEMMRFPFALSDTRFLWQDTTNKHSNANGMEITGTMKKRKYVKSSFDLGFDNFYNLEHENSNLKTDRIKKIKECNKDSIGQILRSNSCNEKRENNSDSKCNSQGVKRNFEYDFLKSSVTGSIANLLEKTPQWEIQKFSKKRSCSSISNCISRTDSNAIISNENSQNQILIQETKYNFTDRENKHLNNKGVVNLREVTNKNGFAGRRTTSMPGQHRNVPWVVSLTRTVNDKISNRKILGDLM
jgi:hypothetical protein